MSSPVRLLSVVVAVALAQGACDKSGGGKSGTGGGGALEIDQARFDREVGQRFLAGADRPEASKGFDGLLASVTADPAIAKDGAALLADVGGDPRLADGLGQMMERVQANPAIQQLAMKLMASHPGASPDEIGQLASDQIAHVTQAPMFDRAWMRAWNELMTDPDVEGVFRRLGEGVAKSPALGAAIQRIATLDLDAKVQKRLTELNGGTVPDRERATDLLLDHAFTPERCATFYATLTGLPVVRRELTSAVRDLVHAPALRDILVEGARTILDDPMFRDRADKAFGALLSDDTTEDQLYQVLRDLLATPSVRRAIVGLLQRTMDDKDLSAIGARTVERIVADPSITDSLRQVAADW